MEGEGVVGGGESGAGVGDGGAGEGEYGVGGESVSAFEELEGCGGEGRLGVDEVSIGGVDNPCGGEGAAHYFEGMWRGVAEGGYGGGIEEHGGAEKEPVIWVANGAESVVRVLFANHEANKPIGKGGVNRESTVHPETLYIIFELI